mmetsp:Transcript_7681/g.15320  ORF Transcript_7681/g.15320 Transcript_7681/m.15320 type:complete len:208 (+) Transcript_7681:1706-2329(+)
MLLPPSLQLLRRRQPRQGRPRGQTLPIPPRPLPFPAPPHQMRMPSSSKTDPSHRTNCWLPSRRQQPRRRPLLRRQPRQRPTTRLQRHKKSHPSPRDLSDRLPYRPTPNSKMIPITCRCHCHPLRDRPLTIRMSAVSSSPIAHKTGTVERPINRIVPPVTSYETRLQIRGEAFSILWNLWCYKKTRSRKLNRKKTKAPRSHSRFKQNP